MVRPTEIDVDDLVGVPNGDELGPADDDVNYCRTHDVLYVERCLVCEREEEGGED